MRAHQMNRSEKNPVRCGAVFVLGITAGLGLAWGAARGAPQTIYPTKDGTLADGSVYGPFDGVADDADWYFNESSYEGSITLATSTPESSLEYRVVWEYDLSGVVLPPPVSGTLHFTIRGAPVYPRPDVDVYVYAYPADLQETLSDFSSGPAIFQGRATVSPFQPPTDYTVDVSAAVSEALTNGSDKVAFRFQVDPAAPGPANQAFIDALDSNPTTKPYLIVDEGPPPPGDVDGDGDVDPDDFSGFPGCMAGPGVAVSSECRVFDFEEDGDVDLGDFGLFQSYFGPARLSAANHTTRPPEMLRLPDEAVGVGDALRTRGGGPLAFIRRGTRRGIQCNVAGL